MKKRAAKQTEPSKLHSRPAPARRVRSPIGSSFSSFLDEQGLTEAVETGAVKKLLALQIAQAMDKGRLSKAEMARQMRTSRSQIDRLLDPDNDRVELSTLGRAAAILGRKLAVSLV